MNSSLKRRNFLAAAAVALPSLRAGDVPDTGGLLASPAQIRRMRAAPLDLVRGNAAGALDRGPWSVTFHRPEHVNTGPNDYYSEGPYWWPDPNNPNGPYIRKDGEPNPARFDHNRRDLGRMCDAVLALGMGAALLGDRRCAARAAKVLSTWFLDPKTRMNPNLEFGQAVRGVTTGRGIGIIDTVSLIQAAQGVALLGSALDRDVAAGVRRWYAAYLGWMITSDKGLDEKEAANNHATWWTAQAAAFAALTGDETAKKMARERYWAYLVPTQIEPGGSCPREEARTASLSYSSMNLDGFAVLCRLAQMDGTDLWHYRTARGAGVEKAFHYLLPYVAHPAAWRKPQISPYAPDRVLYPGLAGVGLHSAVLLGAYRRLPRARSPWIQFADLLVRAS